MLDERQEATIRLQVRLSAQIDSARLEMNRAIRESNTSAFILARDKFRVAVSNYKSFILLAEPSVLMTSDRWMKIENAPEYCAFPQNKHYTYLYDNEDVPF